jgi:hypothetical protein
MGKDSGEFARRYPQDTYHWYLDAYLLFWSTLAFLHMIDRTEGA